MTNIRKFIVAVLGVIAMGLQTFLGIGDGVTFFGLGFDMVAGLVISALTALGVYAVPNTPSQ